MERARDQGGEGNQGEGPAEGDPEAGGPATGSEPSPSAGRPAGEGSDVEAVERGESDPVGSPAEEAERAQQREDDAAEG